MHIQGECAVHAQRYLALCPEWNATFLLFLPHFEAHTLPISVRFQNRLRLITDFWNLDSTLFLRQSTEAAAKVSGIYCYISSRVRGFDQ